MRTMVSLVSSVIIFAGIGCASQDRSEQEFHTSGSREADQRAEQRVARDEQLKNGNGNSGGKTSAAGGTQTPEKKTLFERLGGEQGVNAIVDDFVTRALADPRVNWERKGIERGGTLGIGGTSAEWKPDAAKITALKIHIAQFIALASGGPTRYDGRDMKDVHGGMKITNPEFDASIGDLKASLDKLKIGTDEQKELLAAFESARAQVVEKR
jgi:hemoglobin